eukprot:scaffold874_cov380-Prasinococcus_capsulatus_cf.AAC.20
MAIAGTSEPKYILSRLSALRSATSSCKNCMRGPCSCTIESFPTVAEVQAHHVHTGLQHLLKFVLRVNRPSVTAEPGHALLRGPFLPLLRSLARSCTRWPSAAEPARRHVAWLQHSACLAASTYVGVVSVHQLLRLLHPGRRKGRPKRKPVRRALLRSIPLIPSELSRTDRRRSCRGEHRGWAQAAAPWARCREHAARQSQEGIAAV